MIRGHIRRSLQAGQPPDPIRTTEAEELPEISPTASIAVSRSLSSALGKLELVPGSRTMLLVDRRTSGSPGPRVTHAVAAAIARGSTTTLGLPPNLSESEIRKWRSLAGSAGATTTILGGAGWHRIIFGDRSRVMYDADFPAELYGDASPIAVSAPAGAGVAALWKTYAHPNTRLRVLLASHATIDLSSAVPARYVLIGELDSTWIVGMAAPAIVAELLARGIERLRERSRGYETTGPWEDPAVQYLSSLTEPRLFPTNLALEASVDDNAGRRIVSQLSEMLGWDMHVRHDPAGDDDGERC